MIDWAAPIPITTHGATRHWPWIKTITAKTTDASPRTLTVQDWLKELVLATAMKLSNNRQPPNSDAHAAATMNNVRNWN
jgi:hypothetical protein